MFSNIGWSEIGVIIVVAIIVIGPERLPGLLQDVRAAVFAARKAINNAKQELNGEFEELGSEFEQFREPIQKVSQLSRMGPRAAIAKTLFDEDDDFFQQFDPRTILKDEGPASTASRGPAANPAKPQSHNQTPRNPQSQAQSHVQPRPQSHVQPRPQSQAPRGMHTPNSGGGKAEFSWTDVI
ncbi:Sec-independent protein translocase protein TatB [Corynebacterium propinquum]